MASTRTMEKSDAHRAMSPTNAGNRELGRSGIRIAPVALGGNVFGWTADERTSHSILDAWVDSGMDLVDTADVYSTWVTGHAGGESETVIGSWLRQRGRRDRIVLATKVGKPMGPGKSGLSPAYIRSAVEASLRRLQTDYIDLYQSHEDDAGTPLEATLSTFADLIREGKIRAIGASNLTPQRLVQSLDASSRLGLPRYECVQPLYNLYDRSEFEDEWARVCRQHHLGALTFYALASGFLTGKYRGMDDAGKSLRGAGVVGKYLNARGRRILQALDQVALRHQAQPGQVALAWQLANPAVTAPIASATSVAQVQQLTAAMRLRLTTEDLSLLDIASDGPRG